MGYDDKTYTKFYQEAQKLHPAYTADQLHTWADYSATHYWARLHPAAPLQPRWFTKVARKVVNAPWPTIAIVSYRVAVLVLLWLLTSK